MKKIIRITESELTRVVKRVNKEDIQNEGWFSNLFGNDYIKYSEDLQEMMENLISNVYYDKDLIDDVKELYSNVQNSDMDRRDKKELLDIMNGMYQTLELSKNKLESYVYRLQRLRK
jgi:hypothetical protein